MRGSHPKPKRFKVPVLASVLAIVLITALAHHIFIPRHHHSPFEQLASEFYHIDEQGLHWDYQALSKAYDQRMDSTRRRQLLDLMAKSRASHLVPQIIDSITSGGFRDTETKIRAITQLTGHDFSTEFDITRIWGRDHADDTKRLLHKWWEQNSEQVLRPMSPKKAFTVPNHWPSLTLELKTEKAKYIQLEPIRLTTILNNNSDTWHTFAYKHPRNAFNIEIFQVSDYGQSTNLTKISFPGRWRHRHGIEKWLSKPSFLVVDAGASHVSTKWLTDRHNFTYFFEPGPITIRAVLTPLMGKHRHKQLTSNDLTLEILEPQGVDSDAFKFLAPRQPTQTSKHTRLGLAFIAYRGHVRSVAGDHRLLNEYGDSLYADYVIYTQGTDSGYPPNEDMLRDKLTHLITKAPPDFPLLADAYAHLLQYYKDKGQLHKMSALSETVRLDSLNIVDPGLLHRLSKLTSHVNEVESRIHSKGRFGRTLLHNAAKQGPPPLVKFLISKGATVDEQDSIGQTPLYLAAAAGHKEIAEILIDNGADVNIQDTSGCAVLCWPIHNGHKEIVELLIANGAEVNVTDNSNRTPIHWAASHEQQEILKLLANTTGKHGWTPLHWAARHGKKAMAELLLSNGARVDVKDDKGQTPLDIAIKYMDDDRRRMYIIELLREYEGHKAALSQD